MCESRKMEIIIACFLILYGIQTCVSDPITIQVCENRPMTITCQKPIHIIDGKYGRFDSTSCQHSTVNKTRYNCGSPNARNKLTSLCEGAYVCVVMVGEIFFGDDPCPDVYKYAEVTYSCGASHELQRSTAKGTSETETRDADPNEPITTTRGTASTIVTSEAETTNAYLNEPITTTTRGTTSTTVTTDAVIEPITTTRETTSTTVTTDAVIEPVTTTTRGTTSTTVTTDAVIEPVTTTTRTTSTTVTTDAIIEPLTTTTTRTTSTTVTTDAVNEPVTTTTRRTTPTTVTTDALIEPVTRTTRETTSTTVTTDAVIEPITTTTRRTTSTIVTSEVETTIAALSEPLTTTTIFTANYQNTSCLCNCFPVNVSGIGCMTDDLECIINALRQQLTVPRSSLSSYRKRKISVYDGRTSSKAIGLLGVLILAMVASIFIIPDVLKILRFLLCSRKKASVGPY